MATLSIERIVITLEPDENTRFRIMDWFSKQRKNQTNKPYNDETRNYTLSRKLTFPNEVGNELTLIIQASPKADTTPFLYLEWNPVAVTPEGWEMVIKVFRRMLPDSYSSILNSGHVQHLNIKYVFVFKGQIDRLIVGTESESGQQMTDKDHLYETVLGSWYNKKGLTKKQQLETSHKKCPRNGWGMALEPDGQSTRISVSHGMDLNIPISDLGLHPNMLKRLSIQDYSRVTPIDDFRFLMLLDSVRLRGRKDALERLPPLPRKQYGALLRSGKRYSVWLDNIWEREWKNTLSSMLLDPT